MEIKEYEGERAEREDFRFYFKKTLKILMSLMFPGTCKIDKNCVCTIKAVSFDGKISVQACLSHYGHTRELQHTWVSQTIRQEIAAKIKQGVTAERILDDIRYYIFFIDLERSDFFRNCSVSFGLKFTLLHCF